MEGRKYGSKNPPFKAALFEYISKRRKPAGNGSIDMKIETRDFGEIEIDPEEVLEFRSPIFGFENLKRFALLYDDSVQGPFAFLQSLEEPKVCFILVDPTVAEARYAPVLPAETQKLLGFSEGEQAVWRAITVIPQNFADATVNLKSPIVINPSQKCAAQVILDADYPLRARLMGEGAAC